MSVAQIFLQLSLFLVLWSKTIIAFTAEVQSQESMQSKTFLFSYEILFSLFTAVFRTISAWSKTIFAFTASFSFICLHFWTHFASLDFVAQFIYFFFNPYQVIWGYDICWGADQTRYLVYKFINSASKLIQGWSPDLCVGRVIFGNGRWAGYADFILKTISIRLVISLDFHFN